MCKQSDVLSTALFDCVCEYCDSVFFLLRSSEPERNFTVSYSDVRSGMFRRGMANAECSTQNARLGMLNGVFNGMFEH